MWRQASADLFELVPAQAGSTLIAAASIVIVPDDVLWRVPFEAMPIGSEYLADRATITYATSVAAAARPRPTSVIGTTIAGEATASAVDAPVLVVAAPQVPAPLSEKLSATAPAWVIRPPEAGVAEARRVVEGFKDPLPVVLSDVTATKKALREGLRSARAVHIAAPFRINSAGALFSPILLSAPADVSLGPESMEEATGARAGSGPAPGTGVEVLGESELAARELFDLSSAASVVLFSDPAALSMRDGAAAVGPVHWAWRAAGVPALVVRRWAGAEAAAGEICSRFYQGLRAGKPPNEALHAARAAVRASEDGRAPGAWAGWLILR
jgi:CHAT domain-containing protein